MATRSEIQAGRASVSLGVRNEQFLRGLAQAKRQLQEFGQAATAAGQGMMAIGTAAAIPIGMAVKRFADFDDQMRQVQAVAGASDDEFKKLTETAKNLGATTSFTAAEVAGLMAELGRAGFNPQQIQDATSAILDMSRAAGVDAARAAEVMGSALNQFGLGADQARRVADALALTSNISATGVEDLGEAMAYSGKVAADAGMSIEDTLAVLAALGNVGIKGSAAGTTLQRLLVITGAEAKKLEGIFGVAFTDASGNVLPLVKTLEQVSKATAGMPSAEKTAKMADAFGLLGITGAGAIGAAADQIGDFQQKLKDAEGSSSAAAKKMDAGIGGAFRRIISAIDGVALSIGEALSGELGNLVTWVQGIAVQINDWIKSNSALVVTIAKVVAGVAVAGAALIAFGSVVNVVSFALGGLSIAMTTATAIAGAISSIFTPVGLVVAAVAAYVAVATAAFIYFAEPLNALKPVLTTLQGVFSQLWTAISQGDIAGFVNAVVGGTGRLGTAFVAAIGTMIETAKRKFWELWPTIKQVLNAFYLLAWDVFQQLPKFAGYGIGRTLRAAFDGFVWLGKTVVSGIIKLVQGAFQLLAGLGPELIKSIFSGSGWAGVAKLFARQIAMVGGLVSGITASAAPGFETSAETRAAFNEILPQKVAESTPASPAVPTGAPNKKDETAAKVADAVDDFDKGKTSAEELARRLKELREELVGKSGLEQYKERLNKLNEGLQKGAITARQWREEVGEAQQEFLNVEPPPLDEYAARVRDLHAAFQAGAISGEQFANGLRDAKQEAFDLEASPLEQFGDRIRTLDQAFYAGAISLEQYKRKVAEAKEEILGLDSTPLQSFASRADELRKQLAAGAITQEEYSRAFAEAGRKFMGVEQDPIDAFREKLTSLRQAMSQGLIDPQQFQKAVKDSLPESVKQVIDQTRTPMEKYRKEIAELDKMRSGGLIDQVTYDRRKRQLMNEAGGGAIKTAGGFSSAALAVQGRGQGGGGSPQERLSQSIKEQAQATKVAAAANAATQQDLRDTLAALREYIRNTRYS